MMTRDQAQALTALIHALRPDWDQQGVYAALAKARTMGTAPELAIAAIRAADTPINKTPAVIAMQGPHWQPTRPTTAPAGAWYGPPDRKTPRCPEHTSHPMPCAACRSDWLAGERERPEAFAPATTREPGAVEPETARGTACPPDRVAAIFAAHGLTPPIRKDATA